jgi:NTP pyrophosphatase (non-canonical NTP hydrolase)
MNFDEYQAKAESTNLTSSENTEVLSIAFMDKVLGLVGESGEFADKIKKILRDKKGAWTEADREELIKELGDVLWYIATLAPLLGVSMDEVANRNIAKLAARQQNSSLTGSGDNR